MRTRSSRPFIKVLSALLAVFHLLGPVPPVRAEEGLATFAIIGPPSSLTHEQKALWAEAVEPVRSDPLLLMKDQGMVQEVLAAWMEENARSEETLNASGLAIRGKVQTLLQRAWDFYYALDFKSSLSDLQVVEVSLEGLLDHSLQTDILFESLVLKGMNYRTLGAEDYLGYFEEAAGIKPEAELPSKTFSPDIIAVYEKARKRVRSGPRSTLTVSGYPVGATVFVDGQIAGRSPVTLEDLASGTHFMGIEHEGYEGSGGKITLEDWRSSTFNFDLIASGPTGVPEDFFADRVIKGDNGSLMELSRRLEVDYLVVGSGGADGLVAWLVTDDGNPVSQEILHVRSGESRMATGGLYSMLAPLRAGGYEVVPTVRNELNLPEVTNGGSASGEEMKKGSSTKWYVLIGGVLLLALVAGSAQSDSGGTQVGASW